MRRPGITGAWFTGSWAKWDKAIADCSKAIGLDPEVRSGVEQPGAGLTGSWPSVDKAIADFSKAIELDPSDVSAWNNRGVVYKKLGQRGQGQSPTTPKPSNWTQST